MAVSPVLIVGQHIYLNGEYDEFLPRLAGEMESGLRRSSSKQKVLYML